jgi:hypothetical protein
MGGLERALMHQRAHSDDHRSACLTLKGFADFARQIAEQREIVPEAGDRIGEIDLFADVEDARARLDRLADARVDQRGLPSAGWSR